MKDTKEREKGKYVDEYSKIINGKKVQIKETTTVGRGFEIMSFDREYNPSIPYKIKDGTYINSYSTKESGKNVNIVETTVISNGKVIDFIKTRSG